MSFSSVTCSDLSETQCGQQSIRGICKYEGGMCQSVACVTNTQADCERDIPTCAWKSSTSTCDVNPATSGINLVTSGGNVYNVSAMTGISACRLNNQAILDKLKTAVDALTGTSSVKFNNQDIALTTIIYPFVETPIPNVPASVYITALTTGIIVVPELNTDGTVKINSVTGLPNLSLNTTPVEGGTLTETEALQNFIVILDTIYNGTSKYPKGEVVDYRYSVKTKTPSNPSQFYTMMAVLYAMQVFTSPSLSNIAVSIPSTSAFCYNIVDNRPFPVGPEKARMPIKFEILKDNDSNVIGYTPVLCQNEKPPCEMNDWQVCKFIWDRIPEAIIGNPQTALAGWGKGAGVCPNCMPPCPGTKEAPETKQQQISTAANKMWLPFGIAAGCALLLGAGAYVVYKRKHARINEE
jgi:hypothetical protein